MSVFSYFWFTWYFFRFDLLVSLDQIYSMTLRYFLATESGQFINWILCDFFFDSPLLIISPVNGFFSVGVVIVFSPFCPSLVTFSVPGAKSGLNLRSFSLWNSSFLQSESPLQVHILLRYSLGGHLTSPVSGFLIPGLPGTSSFSLLLVTSDQIRLDDLVLSFLVRILLIH